MTAGILAKGGLPRKACGRVFRGGLYTILGPIVLPPGLCGAYGTTFLLPPGVPEPGGCSEFRNLIRLDDVR